MKVCDSRLIASWILLLGLIGSCSVISEPGISTMDEVTLRALEEIENQSSPRSITSGEVIGISIGDSKDDVVMRLLELGVSHVKLKAKDRLRVTEPGELHRLQYSGAVILFPGDARFTFEGDKVVSSEILPSVREDWASRLQLAGSREEVFTVFSEMLESDPRFVVGNYVPEGSWVPLGGASVSEAQLLEDYDTWNVYHQAPDITLNIDLFFDQNILTEMVVQRFPGDGP